jgi:hypothetical protein
MDNLRNMENTFLGRYVFLMATHINAVPVMRSVILRSEATKKLVLRTVRYSHSENEILRGAEGPEHCRGAQDDMKKGVILSAFRREESL